MRAAVFYEPHKPLRIEDVPAPKITPDEVLVKVAACGVCGTDLHYLHGTQTFKTPPIILGHEASGTVDVVGKKVTEFVKGDSVLIPPVLTCGECHNCRIGRENICKNMLMVGNSVDGAYAEYISVPARDVQRLPKEIPLQEGCIISDTVSTPYHAVKNRAKVKPGDTVAVFGCGGVGLNTVQIAVAAGAIAIAVDLNDEKLRLARELGATEAINVQDADPVKKIREMTEGGMVDVAFEAIGNPKVMEQALRSVRWGGKVVIVGYSAENWSLNVSRVMFRELKILGSLGCRPIDYPRLIEMVRIGKIKITQLIDRKFPLEMINEAFAMLEQHEVIGRLIIVP